MGSRMYMRTSVTVPGWSRRKTQQTPKLGKWDVAGEKTQGNCCSDQYSKTSLRYIYICAHPEAHDPLPRPCLSWHAVAVRQVPILEPALYRYTRRKKANVFFDEWSNYYNIKFSQARPALGRGEYQTAH